MTADLDQNADYSALFGGVSVFYHVGNYKGGNVFVK